MTRQDQQQQREQGDRGGFLALAALAATVGAGAAVLFAPDEGAKTRQRVGRRLQSLRGEAAGTITYLQRELGCRRRQSRQEKQLAGLAGFLIGAGITALLMTERGSSTRRRLGGTLSRIKVGAVDRIDRLRQQRSQSAEVEPGSEEPTVRSVQELGRDPDAVF